MSVSSEVKRTLVKSPPELWSELSDPESLAQHLGGMEGIRITRAEPESAVEWEAAGASGSVRLSSSGFGTRVVLSLTRELPTPEPPSLPAQPDPEHTPAAEIEPERVVEPEPVVEVEPEPVVDVKPVADAEPVAEHTPEPVVGVERKPGFFARLFRRKRPVIEATEPVAAGPQPEPVVIAEPMDEPEPAAEPVSAAEPAKGPTLEPAPIDEPQPPPEPIADVAVDLATLEADMAEQDEAMLTAVLDRLGAAHHRPFSRA